MRHVLSCAVLLGCLGGGSTTAGDYCFDVPTSIPNQLPSGVDTTLEVPCEDTAIIEDLNLLLQIQHTWVGDLVVTLSKQDGPSEVIMDRPGAPVSSMFGCSGDDIDATLDDEATDPVEDACEDTIPTIEGHLQPGDPPGPLMASFEGLELCGTWVLNVADVAGLDSGSIEQWCLLAGPDDSEPPGVPATRGFGVVLTILAVVGSGVLALRGR